MGKKWLTLFLGGSKITADGDWSHEIKRHLLLRNKVITNVDSIFKSRDITLPTMVCLVKAMVVSSGPVWIWELDCEESWMSKNWCIWIMVLEKTIESPLDFKEIQPVHPKGNRSWIFIGRNDAEAPILWPPQAKSWLIRKTLKLERLKARGELDKRRWDDWMASPTHVYEFEWTLGIGDGQRGLACCSSWDHKESEMTE